MLIDNKNATGNNTSKCNKEECQEWIITCWGPREMYAWRSRTRAWMFPGLSHRTGMRRNWKSSM